MYLRTANGVVEYRSRPEPVRKGELVEHAVNVVRDPRALSAVPVPLRGQVDELAKAIGNGASAGWKGPQSSSKPVSAQVIGQRAAASLQPSSNVTPTDIETALRSQGLDWVQPFSPGTPLTPYFGYNRQPRVYNYEIGRNITTETRPDRIPFITLKQLYDSYDIAQVCTRHIINDLRSMRVRFEAMDGYEENPVKEIAAAKQFWRRPDGVRSFKNWMCQHAMDVWRYDAGTIYKQRNRGGKLISLPVIDGTTLAVMVDYFGGRPTGDAPAFQQFIQGVPWDWLSAEDVVYEPMWPIPDSPYGTPPLETVLVNANTDIRLQLYFLQFFTSGQVPEALAVAPEGMTDPDALAELQEDYNNWTYGDQSERWGLRWLPHGTELNFYKPQQFDPAIAEYVMRRTVSAYGLTPQDLGFTDDVNRACYSEDTETLTENGWKPFHEVQPGEKIATFNPDTKELEYHVPTNLYVYPYEGEMVHFRSRNVDCLVTPDHKMWVGNRSTESDARSTVRLSGLSEALRARQGGRRNASGWSVSAVCRRLGIERRVWQDAAKGLPVRPQTARAICTLLPEVECSSVIPDRPAWEKVEAKDLEARGSFWFADTSVWTGGEEQSSFVLPAVDAVSHRKPERHISMDVWLEFLGYIVSEGCIFGDASDSRYPVSISQSEIVNPEKVRAIQACIDELPVRFNRYTDSTGTVRWQVSDKALWTWLREQVGHKSGDKKLPDLWRSLGKRQLAILFDALMLGDGTVDKRPNRTGRTYFTKSSRLADDVQELTIRLGYRASRTTKLAGGVYRVNISEPHDLGYNLRWSDNVSVEQYKGDVWCFCVPPNHLFFTRRNGKVTIAGNTADSQMDTQFRISSLPNVSYYEDILDHITQEELGLPVQIRFDTGREKEDRLMEAQAHKIYVSIGAESPSEVREKVLGYAINPEEKVPLFFDSLKLGPVPISYLLSVAGDIDPLTGMPKPGSVQPREFVVPGATMPDPALGPGGVDETATPVAVPKGQPREGRPAKPDAAKGERVLVLPAPAPERSEAEVADLKRWRSAARKQVDRGRTPKPFLDSAISDVTFRAVWPSLCKATTRDEVDAAFAKAASAGHHSPRSGMVSLDVPPGLIPVMDGGVPDQHITVVFLGSDVDDALFDEVCQVAGAVAAATPGPVTGTIAGVGSFPPSESSDWQKPVWAKPDVPAAYELRKPFERFNASQHKDYHPHMTLAYMDPDDPLPEPIPPTPVQFGHLSVHRGDEVRRFPFGGAAKAGDDGPKVM